jgi:hypothetical protein
LSFTDQRGGRRSAHPGAVLRRPTRQPNPVLQITKIPDDGYLAMAYAKPSGYGSFLPSYYYSPDGWNWHEFTVD